MTKNSSTILKTNIASLETISALRRDYGFNFTDDFMQQYNLTEKDKLFVDFDISIGVKPMIKVKILEIKSKRMLMEEGLDEFIEALKSILDYPLESVEKTDPNFEGYYIMPHEGKYNNTLFTEKNQERIFLLGVVNSRIPDMLTKYKPVGVMQWRLFRNCTTCFYAYEDLLIHNKISLKLNSNLNGYRAVTLIDRDGTYKTTAKAILTYLEMYDKWRCNA